MDTIRAYIFFKEQIESQRVQLFLWAPVIFACGVGTYFALPSEPPITLTLFGFILALCLYILGRGFSPAYAQFFLACVLFASGFSASVYRTHSVATPILNHKIRATSITGNIRQLEKLDEGAGSRLILDHLEIEDLSPQETPRRIRLTLRKDANIRVGERVRLLAGLNPPSGPLISGGFNFRRYLYFQQIGAVGFIYNPPEILEHDSASNSFIEPLRQRIETRIYEVLPPDKASIAAALLVGKKNAISDEDRQAVRDAGLAHMLAISGLHVGIFSGSLFFIFRFLMACLPFLAMRYPIKKIAAVLALAGAVFYMFLAGSTIPTQRSVLMIGIVFLAIILDRSPISLRLVAASALFVLAFRPESLLSVSFQMSFAAVMSLIYFYDVTRGFWIKTYAHATLLKRIALYFLGICITTLIASVATAPFSLYHFGQVSFIGSASNLVAVPLLGFLVMPFALLSLILMPFGLDAPAVHVMGYGIEGMLEIAYWAAGLPYAIIRNPMWPFASFIAINLASLFVMLWTGWGKLLGLPFLMWGIFASQNMVMPDILVDASHKIFMFKEGDNLFTSTRRSQRFVLENWEKLYGFPEKSAILLDYKGRARKDKKQNNNPDNNQKNNHQCGEQGCRFMMKDTQVSFVRAPYILKEECAWADLLISVEPLPDDLNCAASYVVDKFDTWKNGTYALWVGESKELSPDKQRITARSTGSIQPTRPWNEL